MMNTFNLKFTAARLLALAVTLVSLMTCFAPWAQAADKAVNVPPFDHAKTGFLLRDVHTTLRCEQCHVDGVFKNTPRDCAGCHTIGSRVAATPKPINHVMTNAACDSCHVSATSFLVKSFKHSGISTGCASCHNGMSLGVLSKPATHFVTFLPCEACHINTNTFMNWQMKHVDAAGAPITGGCVTCHGGAFPNIISKPALHIATVAPCEACHKNTITFLGAIYGHDPIAVANNCSNCHGGSMPGVVSKPTTHIPVTAQCDTCHTQGNTGNFTTFFNAMYHTSVVATAGSCFTCHNGGYLSSGAMGKSATHVSATNVCDTCHTQTISLNYTSWLGAGVHTTTFNATLAGSGGVTTCSSCHDAGVPPAGAQTKLSVIANHPPTTADCYTCHTQTNTSNFTTFLGAIFAHANPPGVCATCHNGVTAKGQSVPHIPTTAGCDTCHTAANTANYTTFLGASYNHTGVVPGSCANCHNGTYPGVKSKLDFPAHIATTQACDACHTQTNTSNYTTFLGASMVNHADPLVVTLANCATCHNGATAKGLSVGHIPIGGVTCSGCHATYNGTTVLSFYPAAMNHVTTAAIACQTCHNGSYTTQGVAGGAQSKVPTHIPTTITGALDCNTCHITAVNASSAAMSWAYPPEKMNHNNAQGMGTGAYCVTCHLTGVTYLGNMQKLKHNGASAAKDCSSSGCHRPLGSKGTPYSKWN